MNKFHLSYARLAVVAGFAGLSIQPVQADQIVLINGDRVTGSIVKKDGGNLTIKSDKFGVITTPWDQVQSVRTDKPVSVVLKDGKTAQGVLATSGEKIEVGVAGAPLSVVPADINAIRDEDEQKAYERLLRPGWMQLWAGSATLGFAGTSGNARTLTLTTGVNAARVTNHDKTSIYFNSIKASALVAGKNSDTAEAVRGGIAYDHNVSPRLFVNGFNDWEYDKFQNLDLRFVLGGGFGFHAIKTPRSELDLLGGVAFNHSSFTTVTRNSAEFFAGDAFTRKLGASSSFVQSFRMFDSFSDTSDYRANFDIGIATKIARWLTWNVSLSDRYLHRPAAGRKTNDFLYTTGLGVTFAR